MKNEVFIGLTYGDPASIGPEILFKTLKNWKFKFKPLVIGSKDLLTTDKKNTKSSSSILFHNKNIAFINPGNINLGKPTIKTGLHSYECLKEAIKLAKEKKIIGLVTGPVSKEAVNWSYSAFSGQTSEIAKTFDLSSDDVIMLFAARDLRIALFTRHVSLRSVSSKITSQRLKKFILLLNSQIKKWFQIKKPKIAVLGLNPHAGENGMFGDEEKKIIEPTIRELSKKNISVYGPYSPDALLAKTGQDYLNNKKQAFDVYVSFYHDQSLPMFKALAGLNGVNVTLGMPFLRTSVDHGTAFDIAGKNIADNKGLVSAIKLIEDIF